MNISRLVALALFPIAAATAQTSGDTNEGSRLAVDSTTGAWTFSWWGVNARTYFIQTGHTVADARTFRALIEQVRAQDFCAASEEHELAVHAVAVPLRDMDGRTVAALNVVTTRQRLEPRTLQKELLPLLWEAAKEVRPLL